MSLPESLINFKYFPNPDVFQLPLADARLPASPFNDPCWTSFFQSSLLTKVPITILFVYFISVHVLNKFVLKPRQIRAKLELDPKFNPLVYRSDKELAKVLPLLPFAIAKTGFFKLFVILHNVLLCAYSVATFIGMTFTIHRVSHVVLPPLFASIENFESRDFFWQTICNLENGIWSPKLSEQNIRGLLFYSFWFYISKFYEVVDTIIILLKGRQSSLLQSYHHAGAMLSMWSGVRYQSPPIWVFVVFNSFIHSIMYFYYTLSCLHIRVPKVFKQSLTTMQILQFIFGGSLLVCHLFVEYYDHVTGSFKSCIADGSQLMLLWINVIYLTPLTMLFGAFWIESYVRKKGVTLEKKQQ